MGVEELKGEVRGVEWWRRKGNGGTLTAVAESVR